MYLEVLGEQKEVLDIDDEINLKIELHELMVL